MTDRYDKTDARPGDRYPASFGQHLRAEHTRKTYSQERQEREDRMAENEKPQITRFAQGHSWTEADHLPSDGAWVAFTFKRGPEGSAPDWQGLFKPHQPLRSDTLNTRGVLSWRYVPAAEACATRGSAEIEQLGEDLGKALEPLITEGEKSLMSAPVQRALEAMTAAERKATPIYSGFIKYFPDAMAAVAELSRIGNDQHNPGKPLRWDRSKSGDELDALTRHLAAAGTLDTDGVRHSAKVAWRAMANLQKEIERSREPVAENKRGLLCVCDEPNTVQGHACRTCGRAIR